MLFLLFWQSNREVQFLSRLWSRSPPTLGNFLFLCDWPTFSSISKEHHLPSAAPKTNKPSAGLKVTRLVPVIILSGVQSEFSGNEKTERRCFMFPSSCFSPGGAFWSNFEELCGNGSWDSFCDSAWLTLICFYKDAECSEPPPAPPSSFFLLHWRPKNLYSACQTQKKGEEKKGPIMSETTEGMKEKLHLEYHLPADSFLLNAALTFSSQRGKKKTGTLWKWEEHRRLLQLVPSSEKGNIRIIIGSSFSMTVVSHLSEREKRGGGASWHTFQQTLRNIIRSQQKKKNKKRKLDLYLDAAKCMNLQMWNVISSLQTLQKSQI